MKNLNRNAVWMCLFALLGFVAFSFASKVDQIALTPSIDFNQYLTSMPYVYLAPLNLYLQQPTSTILVFALGLVTIYVGIVYLRHSAFITKW